MATKNPARNGHMNRVADAGIGEQRPPAASTIEIPRAHIIRLQLRIRGITPLVMCKFDEKVKRELEEKTEGKAKNKKAPKDPEAEWNAAR